MKITIPELALVVLIGASGSGKSTFARQHFLPTEVVSSDFCRALIADDENDLRVTPDAFELLHFIAAKRLALGRLTVIDATNVRPEDRKSLIDLARQYHVLPVAIVLDMPEKVCWERTQQRADRTFGRRVIRRQQGQLRRSVKKLKREGFRYVYRLTSPEEVAAVVIERQPLWTNRKDDHGPFDIIGDVHGCADELETLLARLGYERDPESGVFYHPQGRRAIFLGDIVDRGPRILDAYEMVRGMVKAGHALCVPGNHDIKLARKLEGRNVRVAHGMKATLDEIDALPAAIREIYAQEMAAFFRSLVSHYVLDDGKLVVAHAGMKEALQGRASPQVRDFALFGETTGETDAFGLPVRADWAADYRGEAMVVYGHTPTPEPVWVNRTINIDTGCVFGGKLTALRYPEMEIVSEPARRTYVEPVRPHFPKQKDDAGLLDIRDVMGKRIIDTRLRGPITIRADQAAAALEVMSRFAVDPRWLIYLPPTMSPSETSQRPDLLEHPDEAFAYYQRQGISRVICEQKHMGSRAIVILGRDEAAVRRRFGVEDAGLGICYTRTGRRFFDDPSLESDFLSRLHGAVTRAGWWEQFETDWVCLDAELMPWSMKAQELIRTQYAAVAAAADASLREAIEVIETGLARHSDLAPLLETYRTRLAMAADFRQAYLHYVWPASSLTDLKLAPFHLMATEGRVHVDRDHLWHMETLAALCRQDEELLLATPWLVVAVDDAESRARGAAWWEELTAAGGEGMVVKPLDFIARGRKGLAQPAIKCRGRSYLRIIYGPEYTRPDYLQRLRSRGLSAKRSLALREFALGVEALERFVRGEPLYRVHECVFGVLALESEPVDPRL